MLGLTREELFTVILALDFMLHEQHDGERVLDKRLYDDAKIGALLLKMLNVYDSMD